MKHRERGFTLIELVLAMAVFSMVFVIVIAGFIGLNRSFHRELAKKQLNDQIQQFTSSISSIIGSGAATFSRGKITNSSYVQICSTESSQRFFWKENAWDTGSNTDDDEGGLYQQAVDGCDKPVANAKTGIIADNYYVRDLKVEPISDNSRLYRVEGLITTKKNNKNSFENFSENINGNVNKPELNAVHCPGSANPESRTCAVQYFNMVVGARNDKKQ